MHYLLGRWRAQATRSENLIKSCDNWLVRWRRRNENGSLHKSRLNPTSDAEKGEPGEPGEPWSSSWPYRHFKGYTSIKCRAPLAKTVPASLSTGCSPGCLLLVAVHCWFYGIVDYIGLRKLTLHPDSELPLPLNVVSISSKIGPDSFIYFAITENHPIKWVRESSFK